MNHIEHTFIKTDNKTKEKVMPSILDRLLALAEKIIRVISFKSVIMWITAAFITITCYTLYEHREAVFKTVVKQESSVGSALSFNVSDSVKSRIRNVVDKEDILVAVTVLTADIRNNRRIPIYWYSDDAALQRQLDNIFDGRFGGIPLFTSDDKNNAGVVAAINAEFTCSVFDSEGYAVLYPGFDQRFPVICKTSVPPFFGQFTGYITLSLNRKPTNTEIDFLKAKAIDISNEIYFKDVLPYR